MNLLRALGVVAAVICCGMLLGCGGKESGKDKTGSAPSNVQGR